MPNSRPENSAESASGVSFLMEGRIFKVLFLCTGNSARSIMAECLVNRHGGGRFAGYSAGSEPRGEVHPLALELLVRRGYDTNGLRSKSWDEFEEEDSSVMDFVFTVCDSAANEPCPVWPGRPVSAHWGLEDPAGVEGTETERREAFARAYGILKERVEKFLALPLGSLETSELRRELEKIGCSGCAAEG